MHKTMKNLTITIIAVSSLSACSKMHGTEIANQAKSDLIGMSKLELYQCAGVPAKKDKVDGIEFLSYMKNEISSDTRGHVEEDSCEATFTIKDGKVSGLNYNGHTSGGLITKKYNLISVQCYYIVKGCLLEF